MTYSLDDLLAASGKGKTTKFKTIGDSYAGKVVSVEVRQDKDDKTGEPEFWPDGKPKLRAVIGFQTDLRDPDVENDDGIRYDYVKLWGAQKKAFVAASHAAGGSPKPGDTYATKFIGEEPPKNPMHSPTKLFEFHFVKANPIDAALDAGLPPAAQVPNATANVPSQAPVGLGAAAPAAPAAPAVNLGQAALTDDQKTQVGMLLGQGVGSEQIAAVLNLNAAAVEAFRAQQAALAGAGF